MKKTAPILKVFTLALTLAFAIPFTPAAQEAAPAPVPASESKPSFFSSLFSSKAQKKIVELVKTGSAADITSALKKDSSLIDTISGDDKQTLLMVAAQENRDSDVIKLLLRAGSDIGKKSKSGKTALMYAAQYESNTDAVDTIIKSYSFFPFVRANRVLKKDKSGKTSFDYAKENSSADSITAVLSQYAEDPAVKAAREAEAKQQEEAAKALAAQQAAEAKALQEQQAATAAAQDAVNSANLLTVPEASEVAAGAGALTAAAGASAAAAGTNAISAPLAAGAVSAAAVSAAVIDAQKSPEKSSGDNTAPAESKTTPSFPVSKSEPVPAVHPYEKVYLFDYNELDDEDTSSLPADNEVSDDAPVFIENADSRDDDGRTKLMTASKTGDTKLIRNLLYSGANIQAADNDGWTSLMFAARFQPNPEVTSLLLKNGAVVTAKNKYGFSALQLASGFNPNPNVVSLLLKNRSIAQDEIRSSFVYAITCESPTSVLQVFIDNGIPVNVSYQGKTPLMYAAETNKDTTIIAWLLEHGAKSGYRTVQGKTAFDFASQNKRLPHNDVYWSLNSESAQPASAAPAQGAN